jgi:hypothetical protein
MKPETPAAANPAISLRLQFTRPAGRVAELGSLALKRTDVRPFPVEGGIVVFEEFSGDWNRQAARRLLENGWSHWYRGKADVDGCRLDLLRLRDGKLEGFPIARWARQERLRRPRLSARIA